MQRRSEWSNLLHKGLQALANEHQDNPPDAFEALKQGELMAESIAQALAPKHVRRPGEVRRAFAFAGNRLLFRELDVLRKARSVVQKAHSNDPELLSCPHRLSRWALALGGLCRRVRRSGHLVPNPLDEPPRHYFSHSAKGTLQIWLNDVNLAIATRQAAVRESYSKARYHNMQNLRRKIKAAHGVLDKRTIQAALGKRVPRQRMWGDSGRVVLGVRINVSPERQIPLLAEVRSVPGAAYITHIHGSGQGLTLWFSGPRQAGDFIAQWCDTAGRGRNASLQSLHPPGQYVAILPDDILAVQEWHMASEGMDTYSICPGCKSCGLHVLTTSGIRQSSHLSNRSIWFFCSQCQSLYNHPDLALMPPCPISSRVLEAMRRIPPGTAPLLNRLVDFATLEKSARGQKNGKQTGVDGQPREFYKYGPTALLELLWKAINAYLRGETPSVCLHDAVSPGTVTVARSCCQLHPEKAIGRVDDRPSAGSMHLLQVLSLSQDYRRTSGSGHIRL